MLQKFLKKLEEIYTIIQEPIENQYKEVSINNFKSEFDIDSEDFIGIWYSKNSAIDRKQKGVVYTPIEISNYMIKNTISRQIIINNAFTKIIDPSCGSGNIIIPCFIYLKKIYLENLDAINKKNNLKLKEETIENHIVQNNLYGYDIDLNIIKIVTIDLFCISKNVSNNFKCKDFLIDDIDQKYDIYISNPPYVGHKDIGKEYSLLLKQKYKQVYKDKGDLSYCFFQKSLSNFNTNGKITIITSRYFLESPSGEQLRKIIKDLCTVYKIVDFYGIRPFKNIGIDPVILFLKNEQCVDNEIEVIKPINGLNVDKKLFLNSIFLNQGKEYNKFYIYKSLLNNKGWILRNEKERNIINKIENKSFTNLSNICESNQGIITGCDKGFIVDKAIIEKENLETDIIKPWIKSSYIDKYNVKKTYKFIIYSDLIKEENKYKNNLKYISNMKEKLLNRRECKKGIRKWYELQWGRKQDIFEGTKIIFPFKASSNKFSLDTGSYFSADVYCLTLKENVPFTYEYLLFLLNNKVYEYYFKTFAKKLGENLYEYYPNNLMKLCIPTMDKFDYRDDQSLYKYFDFNEEEIKIIEKNTEK